MEVAGKRVAARMIKPGPSYVDFHRYSRGGDRSTPIADWQGRARRLVQWDRPFDSCDCSNCHSDALYSSPRAERLLELKSNILSFLLI